MYFTSEFAIVSSTGERRTPFTSATGYGCLLTSVRVLDCWKKWGMRVVGRNSRGASTHFAAQSSVTLVAMRVSGGPGRRFFRFGSTAMLFTSFGRIWYVSMRWQPKQPTRSTSFMPWTYFSPPSSSTASVWQRRHEAWTYFVGNIGRSHSSR